MGIIVMTILSVFTGSVVVGAAFDTFLPNKRTPTRS